MGLGGISVWQLILILLIAVLTLVAVPLPHAADMPVVEEGNMPADESEDDESDEDPPLGVG